MISREASPEGLRNWQRLSCRDKFAAAAWAARHLTRGKSRFAKVGANVLRVGHGHRLKKYGRRRTEAIIRQPVLTIVVDQKWTKVQSRRAPAHEHVPQCVEFEVPLGARRVRVAIPTDVVQERPIPRAHAQEQGVMAMPGGSSLGGGPVIGTACTLVRNQAAANDANVYLLGCHHVIFRSLTTPGAQPDTSAVPFTVPEQDQPEQLGWATRPATFGVGVDGSIDAALVRLNDQGLALASARSYWGTAPDSWADTSDEVALLGGDPFTLWAAGGRTLKLKYSQSLFDQPVAYQGATVRIVEVLVSRTLDPSDMPLAGDSGAPIVSGNVLVGMHIAGEGRLSYAIPAYLLLGSPAFSPQLSLATDLIAAPLSGTT